MSRRDADNIEPHFQEIFLPSEKREDERRTRLICHDADDERRQRAASAMRKDYCRAMMMMIDGAVFDAAMTMMTMMTMPRGAEALITPPR